MTAWFRSVTQKASLALYVPSRTPSAWFTVRDQTHHSPTSLSWFDQQVIDVHQSWKRQIGFAFSPVFPNRCRRNMPRSSSTQLTSPSLVQQHITGTSVCSGCTSSMLRVAWWPFSQTAACSRGLNSYQRRLIAFTKDRSNAGLPCSGSSKATQCTFMPQISETSVDFSSAITQDQPLSAAAPVIDTQQD